MRSRSAIEFQDVAAATFVVGIDLIEADFSNIQEAINNAPANGADIYILPGTYTMTTFLSSVDRPVTLRGGGINATILDFGAVAGKFISIDNDSTINLKALTVWAGNQAGQYLYDVTANYLGHEFVYVEDVMVGKFADTSKDIEGGFIGPILAFLTNVTILLQATAASYFADSGVATPGVNYFTCYDVTAYGQGAQRLKWGGFKNETSFYADACLFGCANFGSCKYVYLSASTILGGGGSSTVTLSSFYCFFIGSGLNDVTVQINNDSTFIGCDSGTQYNLIDRIIDIPAGVNGITITGCNFASWAVETIRNAGSNVNVSGCIGYVTGDVLVTETGAADSNNYWDIDAASTIIGPNSKVNNSKLSPFSTVTTNAFVTALGPLVNPKGLRGSGVIKNTGGNSMDVKELFTDAFGTVSTLTTPVPAGDELQLSLSQNIGTGRPPYVRYEVQVKDTVGGSHTTPSLEFNSQGAML